MTAPMASTAGGLYGTFPTACAHGIAWSLPCASCGRPDYRPLYYAVMDPAILGKLDRIIELLEAIQPRSNIVEAPR